ncbi:nucleotide sugar dehydrogenase [Nitrososphaera sp.]|uniref:nucleotide sugar dehydrogenase n=1 Tax=Nitrososphaera sp. TaxID=1971748 RepID=UPI0031789D84
MKISIVGLGVGYSLAVSLAAIGIKTVGVDINPNIVKNPRYDSTIAALRRKYSKQVKKNLKLTTSYDEIDGSDLVLMVVNTDYKGHTLDIAYVISATKDVLRRNTGTMAVLSTLPYGASKEIAKVIDGKIGYVYIPMMVAQGNLLETFVKPAFLAFGAYEEKYAREVEKFYRKWLKALGGKVPETFVVTPEEAELAKLVSNAFTSTKMTFANMCGELFESLGLNGERIMKVVSTNPTIGPRFFRPGYAFGGQCFPRDLDTFITLMKEAKVEPGILEEVQNYNLIRTHHPLSIYPEMANSETMILGIAYKSGIADTRFSPSLDLYNELKKKGAKVQAYDSNLEQFGNPKELSEVRTLVIATNDPENKKIARKLKDRQLVVLDYANMVDEKEAKRNKGWALFKAGKGWVKRPEMAAVMN